MSYVKTEWQTGDLITADKINKIEDGIEVLSEGYEELKGDLDELEDSVIFVKNLIVSTTQGKFTNVSVGNAISFSDNDEYGYGVVIVDGSATYSINNFNFNNNFSVVCDANGIILGRLRDYYTSGEYSSVYTMPSTAKYIYLCSSQFSASGDSNVVVLETDETISGIQNAEKYNTDNYPFNTLVQVIIDKQYCENKGKYLYDILDSIPNDFEPFADSYYYQYIDKSKWHNGKIWMLSGNIVESDNRGYNAYPKFSIPKGNYPVVNCSGNFSFALYEDGTVHAFRDIVINGILVLPQDATLYISNGNIDYTMVIDGEVPVDSSGNIVFVSGKFHKSSNHIIYCGSKRRYKTLRSAIEKATEYFDSTVYVDAETFDLAVEFADVLETYDGTNQREGITLKNRVHVIFASGSKVVFDYNGSNENVYTCFSPFNAGEYGFTLENAYVESKNCRYSVHDELNSSQIPYFNKYLNCTFIHDSSNSVWGAHQAIGGGLGCHASILIENCYGKAVGYDDNVFSYHNASSTTITDTESRIDIKNCYIEGTVRCSNYGVSEKKSKMYVSGCRLKSEPRLEKTITDVRKDNMELIAWNNVIVN